MAVIICHHHSDGGIGDADRVAPGLAPVIIVHRGAFGAAEPDGRFTIKAVIHLVNQAVAQLRGLIADALITEFLQPDGTGTSRQRGYRKQTQNTDQREQQGRQPGSQGMVHFLHRPFLS